MSEKPAENEPNIIKEFRNLYDYVVLMGRHINGIHARLDTIEANIKEINSNQNSFLKENATEIEIIRENMVNKDEFNNLIDKMKISIGEELPALPSLQNSTQKETESLENAPVENPPQVISQ